MEVTVDGGAEGEAGTEQDRHKHRRLLLRNTPIPLFMLGIPIFADHVFHLTDKQKELAKNYAENLTAFLELLLPA